MSLLLRNYNKFAIVPMRNYSEVVNVFGRRNVDTVANVEKGPKTPVAKVPETAEKVAELSGHPQEHINDRTVRIFVKAKNSMQSGTYQLRRWSVEFENRERWENPLTGWGSSGDPLSSMSLEFNSKDDAMVYCERMGYNYSIEDAQEIKKKIKSYGANFSWNKKTRRSTK